MVPAGWYRVHTLVELVPKMMEPVPDHALFAIELPKFKRTIQDESNLRPSETGCS